MRVPAGLFGQIIRERKSECIDIINKHNVCFVRPIHITVPQTGDEIEPIPAIDVLPFKLIAVIVCPSVGRQREEGEWVKRLGLIKVFVAIVMNIREQKGGARR